MAEMSTLRDRALRYLQKMQDEEKSGATPGRLKNYIGCESEDEFNKFIEYMFERGEVAIMPAPRGGRGRKSPMIFCTRRLRGPQTPVEMIDTNFVPKITKDENVHLKVYAERHGHLTYYDDELLKGEEAVSRIREIIQKLKRFTMIDLIEECSPAIDPEAVKLYVQRHNSPVYPEAYCKYRLASEGSHNQETVYQEAGEPKRELTLTPEQSALKRLAEAAKRYNDLTEVLKGIKERGGMAHRLFDAPDPVMDLRTYEEWLELTGYTEDELSTISNYGPLDTTNIMLANYRLVERVWINDPDYATEENAELLGKILTMESELTQFEGF